MMRTFKILSFEAFNSLNEASASVPMIKDVSDFFHGLLKYAKEEGKIKKAGRTLDTYRSMSELPGWMKKQSGCGILGDKGPGKYTESRAHGVLTPSGKYFETAFLHDTHSDYARNTEEMRIIVASDSHLDMTIIDSVFPEEVEGSLGSKAFLFRREVETDHSNVSGPVNHHEYNVSSPNSSFAWKSSPAGSMYYVVLKYTREDTVSDDITFDAIINSEFFKKFMRDYPVDLISTKIQRKNGTIVLAIPTSNVIFPKGWKEESESNKYFQDAFALYPRGYIRLIPTVEGAARPIDNFDSSKLSGWEKGLAKIGSRILKLKKDLEKKGAKLLMTPEEKHHYRGTIHGNRFSI